jgi:hypothetical protein
MTRLVYILAASHSGSTLLARLLAQHPRVCSAGELNLTTRVLGDITRYRCSCRRLFLECRFWRTVAKQMRERGFRFDLANPGTDYLAAVQGRWRRLMRPLHRGALFEAAREAALAFAPGYTTTLAAIQARNAALAEVICSVTGSDLVVDSSKIGLRLKYLLRNPALDVLTIRLVRDARGVSLAYMDPDRFADAANPAFRGGGAGACADERLTPHRAAHDWRRSIEEADAVLRGIPPHRWTTVRYEDVCERPHEVLVRLHTFLRLDPAEHVAPKTAPIEHIIGNGMRFDELAVRRDERWKQVLTSDDRRAIERVAGTLNGTFGYG